MLKIFLSASCLVEIHVSKILFSSVPSFYVVLFGLLLSNFLCCLYILDLGPLSDLGLHKIFSQCVGCNFIDFLCFLGCS